MSDLNLNLFGDWIFAASFQEGLITAGLQRNALKKKKGKKKKRPACFGLWCCWALEWCQDSNVKNSSGFVASEVASLYRKCDMSQSGGRSERSSESKPRRPAAHDLARLLRKGCAQTNTSSRLKKKKKKGAVYPFGLFCARLPRSPTSSPN